MQTVVILVGCKNYIISPGSIIRVVDIVDKFVNVAFGFLYCGTGYASHAKPEVVLSELYSRVVIKNAKEVVAHIAVLLVVADGSLVGENGALSLGVKLSVVVVASAKHKQVLVFVLVAVIEHLAHQTYAHGIGCATRELVEYFLLVEHVHHHVVVVAVHLCHSLGLWQKLFAGYDNHVGVG